MISCHTTSWMRASPISPTLEGPTNQLSSNSRFLNLSIIDIRGQGRESYPMHCRMFNSISDLYPLDASNNPPSPAPSGDNQKCLQTLPSVPQGTKSPWLETHCSNCTQCPSACMENGTVSSISLEHSQHNNQASKRKTPAEKETSSSMISCVSSI